MNNSNFINAFNRIRKIVAGRPLLATIVTALAYYVSGVSVILLLFGQQFLGNLSKKDFLYYYLPCFLLVFVLTFLQTKWPRQMSRYIMGFICIAFLALGLTRLTIFTIEKIWGDLSWEPSIFGVWVLVVALSVTLSIVIWPPKFSPPYSASIDKAQKTE